MMTTRTVWQLLNADGNVTRETDDPVLASSWECSWGSQPVGTRLMEITTTTKIMLTRVFRALPRD